MGRSDKSNSRDRITPHSQVCDDRNAQWRFLGFDAEYRPVQIHTDTNRIRTLDEYIILWDEQNNPAFISM